MSKKRIYYYYDEVNDDFANTNIKNIPTPRNYKYYHPLFLYRIWQKIVLTFVFLLCKIVYLFLGIKVKNKKVLKKLKSKKKGYFIYGNHTSFFVDAVSASVASFPKTTSIICNSDAISVKGIKHLVSLLGAYPVPTQKETYFNFVQSMRMLVNKGHAFMIYPEAHIWPHYNKIRDFPITSFYYPVKFDVPCFTKTTIYRKNRFGKYKIEIIFDGPFYPNKTLGFNEAKEALCLEVKNNMKMIVNKYQSEADPKYQYIKVDDKKDVGIIMVNK